MNDAMESRAREELVYSFGRLQWLGGWWSYALAVAVLGLLIWGVLRLYRRDTIELPGPTRWALMLLRVGVIAGLVVFLLGIERRARQRVTRPSEVAVLVDTSQSMSLPQDDEPGGRTRIEAAAELVSQTPLVGQLARGHRVTLYTFDATGELNEVVTSNEAELAGREDPPAVEGEAARAAGEVRSPLAIVGALLLAASLVGMLLAVALQWLVIGSTGPAVLLASVLMLIPGGGLLGAAWTSHTDRSLVELLGIASPASRSAADDAPAEATAAETGESTEQRLRGIDWPSVLVAAGPETRMGDALRATLGRHDPATLAGVVLLTDGQNNAGTPPINVAALVGRGGTAIYPIGFGSSKPPINVRIVDLDVPRRVYPGDKFAVSTVLQASGPEPQTVQVQLWDAVDREAGADSAASEEGASTAEATDGADAQPAPAGELIDSREVTVAADGELTGVPFELEPQAVGKRQLTVRIVPPAGDQNAADNQRVARYEVVSRRLRTLLVAGGPMREYRFVRNLLFRDKSIEVDVWLQTGQPGMSQEADAILRSFPATPEELFEYDAILAFDPDWTLLDAGQLELLDKWLSQQAGGLALISGPVYLPEWMRQRTDPRVEMVRDFYPVRLPTRGPLLAAGRTGGDTAWPLQLTPDGMRADLLRLDDSDRQTELAWDEFEGVYDYVGVQDAKPGARVYAYFSDPAAAIDEQLPIYLASQFYGAGRVFFQGSGEMWRLRGVSIPYFEAYYTKLVRWISEGRLLRDSNRGILLVDRPRAMVGDTITVRAILTDEQFRPLRVPQVEAKLLTPGGRIDTVRLSPLQGEPREGTYTGRFLIREPGGYELRVTLGSALEEEVLRQPVQAGVPTLELESPRRNDEVMRAMASSTGGRYVPLGFAEQSGGSSQPPADPLQLVDEIEPQPQLTILPGTPDRDFQRRHHASLMWLLCALLTMEWMVRRLNRLA
jgi:hypothetical protein